MTTTRFPTWSRVRTSRARSSKLAYDGLLSVAWWEDLMACVGRGKVPWQVARGTPTLLRGKGCSDQGLECAERSDTANCPRGFDFVQNCGLRHEGCQPRMKRQKYMPQGASRSATSFPKPESSWLALQPDRAVWRTAALTALLSSSSGPVLTSQYVGRFSWSLFSQ